MDRGSGTINHTQKNDKCLHASDYILIDNLSSTVIISIIIGERINC